MILDLRSRLTKLNLRLARYLAILSHWVVHYYVTVDVRAADDVASVSLTLFATPETTLVQELVGVADGGVNRANRVLAEVWLRLPLKVGDWCGDVRVKVIRVRQLLEDQRFLSR